MTMLHLSSSLGCPLVDVVCYLAESRGRRSGDVTFATYSDTDTAHNGDSQYVIETIGLNLSGKR